MSNGNEPLIKLEPGGKAPILSYNIPEPTSYSGRNFIQLDFLNEDEAAEDFFKPVAFETPDDRRQPVRDLEISATETAVIAALKSGFSDRKLFPNVKLTTGVLGLVDKPNPGYQLKSSIPISDELANLDPEEVSLALRAGKRFNIYSTLHGTLTYNYIDEPTEVRPALYLIEEYRLSSFLGNYGAGRIIKTFTLLPGEATRINIKTYTKTETEQKSASSILDSFTEESAQDFESSVQQEQSNKQGYSETFEYHVEAEAKASWGWGSAKVNAGVKGGTNSSREEFAKNISSSTQKHASKASAKRDVQINTSYEVTEQTGEETSIEREIENINLSRTLNFIFRQMNQEFITLLHLVDVRVAFFNGFAESRREVTLPELDSLLEEFVQENRHDDVRNAVFDALSNILDYKGDLHIDFIEERTIDQDKYTRVNTDKISVFRDEITGTEIPVPGIILSDQKNVLRTEGVIVEALLGQGDALDTYATRLQELEVERREAEISYEKANAERANLLNQIVQDNDGERAKLLTDLTCPCQPESPALRVTIDSKEPEGEKS